mmetsp:Transcript_35873/g.83152  ORF Transcript_35873/g.83152 Transcript_35873/m.83152 type:complete len:231 (+) Transcript_35873:172-864(+)
MVCGAGVDVSGSINKVFSPLQGGLSMFNPSRPVVDRHAAGEVHIDEVLERKQDTAVRSISLKPPRHAEVAVRRIQVVVVISRECLGHRHESAELHRWWEHVSAIEASVLQTPEHAVPLVAHPLLNELGPKYSLEVALGLRHELASWPAQLLLLARLPVLDPSCAERRNLVCSISKESNETSVVEFTFRIARLHINSALTAIHNIVPKFRHEVYRLRCNMIRNRPAADHNQ